jgi:hypothetical protein
MTEGRGRGRENNNITMSMEIVHGACKKQTKQNICLLQEQDNLQGLR